MEELYYQIKSYALQGAALLLELVGAMIAWVQRMVGTASEKTKDCAYAAEQKILSCGVEVVEKVKETGGKVKDLYEANKKTILLAAAAVSAVVALVAVFCCVKKCGKKS